jgi:dolichyl-phosphate beta-glucosyltransferase
MSAQHDPYLSIIVPAYNESVTIGRTLSAMREYLDGQSFSHEIIVCADGTDGTREQASCVAPGDPQIIVVGSDERGGKGRAVRNGVMRAAGRFIGFVDADYKTPIEELSKIVPWLERGEDVVIGSRRMADARIAVPQPLYRRLGSRAFSFAMRGLVGLHGIRDTQCGFKFFQRAAARRLFSLQRVDGYMFDVEILRLARLLNYRIREVGVAWQDDGDSRYNPVAGTFRNARDLLRIRRMRYDLAAIPAEPPVREIQYGTGHARRGHAIDPALSNDIAFHRSAA